eukprot:1159807-Pelagomonas_calceolata.AAC.9
MPKCALTHAPYKAKPSPVSCQEQPVPCISGLSFVPPHIRASQCLRKNIYCTNKTPHHVRAPFPLHIRPELCPTSYQGVQCLWKNI